MDPDLAPADIPAKLVLSLEIDVPLCATVPPIPVPPEAAWRQDRGKLIEGEFGDSLKVFGGGGVTQAVRQCFSPSGVVRLKRDQFFRPAGRR